MDSPWTPTRAPQPIKLSDWWGCKDGHQNQSPGKPVKLLERLNKISQVNRKEGSTVNAEI